MNHLGFHFCYIRLLVTAGYFTTEKCLKSHFFQLLLRLDLKNITEHLRKGNVSVCFCLTHFLEVVWERTEQILDLEALALLKVIELVWHCKCFSRNLERSHHFLCNELWGKNPVRETSFGNRENKVCKRYREIVEGQLCFSCPFFLLPLFLSV